jgi:ATPase family associated with various cellular activities (AAA)
MQTNPFTTRESIYKDPTQTIHSPNPAVNGLLVRVPPRIRGKDIIDARMRYAHGWTPEFADALASEASWPPFADSVIEDEAIRGAIGAGSRCPTCGDKKTYPQLSRGSTSGAVIELMVSCPCAMWHRFKNQMEGTPAKFMGARLATLQPSALAQIPATAQQKIINEVKGSPDDSYFLFGPPGTGKTHIATALYAHAVEASVRKQFVEGGCQRTVWRITASVLMNEHIAWDTRDKNKENSEIPSPTVSERLISNTVKTGFRPALFLDEIDKLVPTEFKLNRLGEIVDAIYANNGQLVATSNKSVADLVAKWGSDEALTVLRRIGAGPGAHMINFAS